MTIRRDIRNGVVDDETCRRVRLIAAQVRRVVLISSKALNLIAPNTLLLAADEVIE